MSKVEYVPLIQKFMLELERGYDAANRTPTQIVDDLFPEFTGEDRSEVEQFISKVGQGLIKEEN